MHEGPRDFPRSFSFLPWSVNTADVKGRPADAKVGGYRPAAEDARRASGTPTTMLAMLAPSCEVA